MSGTDAPLVNVADYERAAEALLEPGPFGYFAGGAGDEWTLRENVAAFRRWVLRPRVLVDVGTITTRATILGDELSLPVIVAPTAFQRFAHPEGELATARGAAAAGTVMCLSTLSSTRPGELAATAPDGRHWLQLYWSSDREFVRALLEEAASARFAAIVLTVDLPVTGRRERDLRTSFEIPPDFQLPNISPALERPRNPGAGLGAIVDRSLTWRDIEWLRSVCPLPLVVKGVLTAEDATLAVEHGADAVVVSNHGGRQLDGVAASLDALPEVVEAVDGRAEILVDGGVRRGIDVVTALALGASGVMAGRAILWGLAVAGEQGVQDVLELLRGELEAALVLLGCTSPRDVARDHVGRAAQ